MGRTYVATSTGDSARKGLARAVSYRRMPEFVIEREIPGAANLTEDEIAEVSIRSLQLMTELGSRIQWVHSYVTDDRIYCVYLAPDAESIREHARRLGVPANRVSAVRRMIDPKKYQ
jgi:hypothetical protein